MLGRFNSRVLLGQNGTLDGKLLLDALQGFAQLFDALGSGVGLLLRCGKFSRESLELGFALGELLPEAVQLLA